MRSCDACFRCRQVPVAQGFDQPIRCLRRRATNSEAKGYALSVCPELKTAKVLWVGSDPDQIPAQVLSGNVVIKANCSSGSNVMVCDGKVDRASLKEITRRWLARTYGQKKGEWGYKNGRRCLFVEEMLLEDGQPVRQEYKFHVSGGRIAYIFVARRMDDGSKRFCHLARDGRLAPFQKDSASTQGEIKVPATFDRLAAIAERLAASFDYMRCDFYERDGEIFLLGTYALSAIRLQHRNAVFRQFAQFAMGLAKVVVSDQSAARLA